MVRRLLVLTTLPLWLLLAAGLSPLVQGRLRPLRLLWLAANVDLESGMVAEGLAQSLLIGTDEHKQAVQEARWRR